MPIFNRVRAMNDDEPGDCLNLGLLFKNAGRFQTARDWITKAIRLQPDNGLAEVWPAMWIETKRRPIRRRPRRCARARRNISPMTSGFVPKAWTARGA